jgi:tRNA1Val (adenine37-N6)-methyltransferase
MDEGLTRDAFLSGRLHLWQPRRGFRAATDPVLLAAACPARPGDRVLDLGTGIGSAALCLATRVTGLDLWGLELQPGYADLARRNAAETGLPMTVVTGDLSRMPAPLRHPFDQVIANPPYYPRGGTPAADPGRALAMQGDLPLSAWVEAAARRLAPGGWLTMIFATDALAEVLAALGPRLGSASILPLAPRDGRPALRVILRARKGGRAALRLLPPLVVHRGPAHDGDRDSYTPRANQILRDGQALDAEFG